MRRTPPLIVGAGPAGCMAAITLAQQGVRPRLLDQTVPVGDALCGGFLSWRSARRLADAGVDVESLGAHRVDRLALFAAGRVAECPLPEVAWGLSRRKLDGALRDRAASLGVAVEKAHVRERPAGCVFLATGKHDLRGATRQREERDPSIGLRLRMPGSADLAAAIELHAFTEGYAGVVMQDDGTANIALAVRKSLLRQAGGSPSALVVHLANEHPAFGARLCHPLPAIEAIGAVPYGWIARDTDPALFRLGDQAAVIPSLAGEGIGMALASGCLAANYWLAGGDAAARAYQQAFAARAQRPVRVALILRRLMESSCAAQLGVGLVGAHPSLAGLAMRFSRLD